MVLEFWILTSRTYILYILTAAGTAVAESAIQRSVGAPTDRPNPNPARKVPERKQLLSISRCPPCDKVCSYCTRIRHDCPQNLRLHAVVIVSINYTESEHGQKVPEPKLSRSRCPPCDKTRNDAMMVRNSSFCKLSAHKVPLCSGQSQS